MNWTKIRQNIDISLFVLAFMLANGLFWISWHNLDQINGYAMLFNDINALEHCDDNFYNIRDVKDCGGVYCPDYHKIYVRSKILEVVSYLLFVGIIVEFLVRKWKKKFEVKE